MAQLRNLGQPFGSPGGIINIPAPAGSALAGQIQMRAMAGLGQALGMYLGQRRAGQLRQEDIRRLQAMGPQQDIFNTMYGARGLQAPQAQMPQMVSPMGQELALQGQLGNIFADPLEREYLKERISATKALTKSRLETEDNLTEKDIISIMHTLERAMAATHDAAGFPLEGPEYAEHRKYYAEQLEHYKELLQRRRAEKQKPQAKLEDVDWGWRGNKLVKKGKGTPPPEKPEEVLGGKNVTPQDMEIWNQLDEETKKLVARAVRRGAKKSEIIAALRARGAIK